MTTDKRPSDTPKAEELVRNLIELEADSRSDEISAPASATLATSERLYRELSRWVGPAGCHALFTRALADSQTLHPLLIGVRLQNQTQPYFDGTTEIIAAYGPAATSEALEAMLVTLVEILGRLIGDDMAMKLILQSLPEFVRDTREHDEGRKKA